MSALSIAPAQKLVRLFISLNLLRLGIQLQRPAESYGCVGQMDQGHRVVSQGHVGIGFPLATDRVEKICLVA